MEKVKIQKLDIEDYDSIINWSYRLARNWVVENIVSEGVVSARTFERYKRDGKYLPKHFPRIPHKYFTKKGTWKGWRDFLGNPEQKQGRSYLSYTEAARIARLSKIQNCKSYREWKNRPINLPNRPELYYKDEWDGWEVFLGSNYKKRKRGFLKLGASDVRIIKHQLNMGVSGATLARMFNVSEMQISRIKSGENWSEL